MLRIAELRWVFLDVGSTLTDETAAHWSRSRQLARLLPRQSRLPPEQLMSLQAAFAQRGAESPYRALLDHLELGQDIRSTIESNVSFDRNLEVPYDGAPEAVATVSAKFKVGVIANQPRGLAGRLASQGFVNLDLVLVSEEVGLSKPDHALFAAAIDRAGTSASQSVMVGDRLDNDIAPAHALGMQTVWVKQGWRNPPCKSPAIPFWDAEIEHFSMLPGLLHT